MIKLMLVMLAIVYIVQYYVNNSVQINESIQIIKEIPNDLNNVMSDIQGDFTKAQSPIAE